MEENFVMLFENVIRCALSIFQEMRGKISCFETVITMIRKTTEIG